MKENHCTSWPEAWWSDCCKAHDKAYELQIERAQADKELFSCVYNNADGFLIIPSFLIACLMYIGVRAFGWKYYKKK